MLRKAVMGQGWKNHPEARRFADTPELIVLRHELLRIEMDHRWHGRHGMRHPSPMDEALPWRHYDLYVAYTQGQVEPEDFARWITSTVEWPKPAFVHDTPWDRDGMTQEQYVALGDDWSARIHKRGQEDG